MPTAKARVGPQSVGAKGVQEIKPQATSERIRVAVIEDDDSVRQALSFQLRTAGFEVAAYSSQKNFSRLPLQTNSIVSWRTFTCPE